MSFPWPSSTVDLPNQKNWEELARRIPWGTDDLEDDSVTAGKVAPGAVPGQFVWITETNVVSTATAVAWTPLSISAHTGSNTAKIALLSLYIIGTSSSASFVSSRVRTRQPTTGFVGAQNTFTSNSDGTTGQGGGLFMGPFMCPLDDSEQFEYEVVFNHTGSLLAQIYLNGYII